VNGDIPTVSRRRRTALLFSTILNNYGYALLQQRKLDEARAVPRAARGRMERLGNLRLAPIVLSIKPTPRTSRATGAKRAST